MAPGRQCQGCPSAAVFVTAQTFELEALDCLTTLGRLACLQSAVQKVELITLVDTGLKPDLTDEVLTIQDRGSTERVPLAEVLYFKA